jgi:hypothetical protein
MQTMQSCSTPTWDAAFPEFAKILDITHRDTPDALWSEYLSAWKGVDVDLWGLLLRAEALLRTRPDDIYVQMLVKSITADIQPLD